VWVNSLTSHEQGTPVVCHHHYNTLYIALLNIVVAPYAFRDIMTARDVKHQHASFQKKYKVQGVTAMTHAHASEVISPEIAAVHERRLTFRELKFLSGDLREEIALSPTEQIDRFHEYLRTLPDEERAEVFNKIDGYKTAKLAEATTYLGAMAAEAVVDHSQAKSVEQKDYVAGSLLKKILVETEGISDIDRQKILDSVTTLLDGRMVERAAGAGLRVAAEMQARLEASEENLRIMTEHAENLRSQIEEDISPALHTLAETYQYNLDVLDDIAPAIEVVDSIDASLPELIKPRPTTAELERIVGFDSPESAGQPIATPPYARIGLKAVEILNGLIRR
jgi:hypothetical protein